MQTGNEAILSEAYSRLQGLRRAVVELGPEVQYAPSARFLWNLLLAGVDGLVGQLEAAPPGSDALPDFVSGVVGAADTLHFLLSLVEAGAASRVPQAILPSLHELLLDPSGRILVCSDWSPSNYAFHQRFPAVVRDALGQCVNGDGVPERVKAAADQVPDVFAVLSFPVSERDNVLLHASLGHEIGHALVERYGIPPLDTPPGVDAVAMAGLGVGYADLYQLVLTWCRELVADAWAICLMGPAPFMSAHSLLPADPPHLQHPASWMRFLLMQECLRRTGFLGDDGAPTDMCWLPGRIDSALTGAAGSVTNAEIPAAPLAHALLKHNLPAIVQFVLDCLERDAPHLTWSRDRWEQGVVREDATGDRHHALVERLLNYCPPDRLVTAGNADLASLAAVLCAGWSVLMSHQAWSRFSSVFRSGDLAGQDKARRKLQALILKAMEIIGVERQWRLAG